jgi:lysophospholipase L1-like esterase
VKIFKNFHFLYLALLVTSCWSGCKDDTLPEAANQQGTPAADTTSEYTSVKYLALGDSYTIGQSVPADQRWPEQLGLELKFEGYDSVGLQIIARTGWTTNQLENAIEEEDPQGPFDLVSLLIGVNNQFQGLDSASYRLEFRGLLQQAINFAHGNPGQVIVVSIPDYSVTPFAERMDTARIADEIDGFNLINYEETMEAGVAYIDVTPISRLARIDLTLLASDGLHPSGKMYRQWVKLITPVAVEILEDYHSSKYSAFN